MTCFIPTLAFLVVKKKASSRKEDVESQLGYYWASSGWKTASRVCAAAAAVYPMEVEMLG
jgi:hypothetical protein